MCIIVIICHRDREVDASNVTYAGGAIGTSGGGPSVEVVGGAAGASSGSPSIEAVGGVAAAACPAEPTAKQAAATSSSPCIVIVIASFVSG